MECTGIAFLHILPIKSTCVWLFLQKIANLTREWSGIGWCAILIPHMSFSSPFCFLVILYSPLLWYLIFICCPPTIIVCWFFFLMVILAYHCKIAVGQSTSSRFQLSCFYVGKYRWPNLACNLQASYYNCLPYFLLLSFHISDHYRFRALFLCTFPVLLLFLWYFLPMFTLTYHLLKTVGQS